MEVVARDVCAGDSSYDGQMGARVSAIFVILIAGSFGALVPIIATRSLSGIHTPHQLFFVAKYFGSGVIIATSLIHLLQPANEALTTDCLGPKWQEYPYAFGICLFVMFLTFFIELVSMRYLKKFGIEHTHGPSSLGPAYSRHTRNHQSAPHDSQAPHLHGLEEGDDQRAHLHGHHGSGQDESKFTTLAPATESCDSDLERATDDDLKPHTHSLGTDLGGILFLEFGIIFHSVFVGLTLAVAGEEFKMLYIVLVFHQLFEGLGLGTRLATAPWPPSKHWMPWAFGIAFGLTTPIAIAVGLGVRHAYAPGSAVALITNGVFDSISSGILLYTGLVELVANEFLHSKDFEQASFGRIMSAFFVMCAGAGLMALLGRWA